MSNDTESIAALHRAFQRQHDAQLKNPSPSTLPERIQLLAKIPPMMIQNRQRIRDALAQDFGIHPDGQTDLIEVMGPAGRAAYAMEQLEQWMKPSERFMDQQIFGNGKAYIQYEPKGIVGNIIPWNFPFELGFGPLIEMLAAGNRVIMKPSDMTPACAKLMEKMVAETFDPDMVTVVSGGVELAKTFSTLKWDHLLYTGSPTIGKSVMAEAAKNLVPVTLELGGKCPAILTPGGVDERAVESIVGVKLIKNGQMCSSIDTVHVHHSDVKSFTDLVKQYYTTRHATFSQSPDCTGLIAKRHYDRLVAMLNQVRDSKTAEIVQLEPNAPVDEHHRRLPLTLVINAPDDSTLMKEEVFGPLLPIRTYDQLDDVIQYINERDRPLGLYVLGPDDKTNRHVIQATRSGGACINACAIQGALPSLGFGGIGTSGFGRHHGVEGFKEFSNSRGVFERAPLAAAAAGGGGGDMLAAFYPPFDTATAMTDHAIQAATATPPK